MIGTTQRVGSAVGIAIIGTVLFGTLHFGGYGRTATALAFGHSATLAMAVSAGLSVAAFALGFALPKHADDRGDDGEHPHIQHHTYSALTVPVR